MCNVCHVFMLKAQRVFIFFKYHICPYQQLEGSQGVSWQTIHTVGDHTSVKSRIFLSEPVFFFQFSMVGIKSKISKICLSGLAEIAFLESFLCKKHVISAIFFLIELLVFMLALLHQTPIQVSFSRDKNSEFPGQVRRKVLGILHAFNWFIFS